MKLLAFDTSSKALSVAILEDETLLAETTLTIKKNHSITLMPVIDFLMQQIDLKDYRKRFSLSNLPVTKVGVNFDSEKGNIADWMIQDC